MPINWQDGSSGGTPLSAANLNRLAVVADIGTTGTPTGDAVKSAAAAQVTDAAVAQQVTSGATTTTALKAAFAPRWGSGAPGEAGIPKLMTFPPTISAATVGWAASTITSAVTIPAIVNNVPNTNVFSFRGAVWAQYGTSFPDTAAAASKPLTGGEGGTFPCIEFLYYGTAFEYVYKGQGTLSSRVWVDGQPAENAYAADTTQDGQGHTRKVTFTAPGWRHIRLDLLAPFFQLQVSPTDVVAPAPSTGDRLLVIGDSYGEGTGANFMGGYAVTLGQMLGFNDTVSLSEGGTGVLGVNSTLNRPKYRDRSGDWAQVNATHVLLQMSVNDDPFSFADLTTELNLLIPILKGLPTVKHVWAMGRAATSGTNVSYARGRDAGLQPVIEGLGVPYIPLVSPTAIWSGTGHQGATAGDGTSDVLVWTDGVHPSQAGHDGIARVFVKRLLARLNS